MRTHQYVGDWTIVIDEIRPFPTITIRVNDSVTWVNQDDESHGLLGDNIESPTLSPGQSYTAFFNEEGTQRYACTFHTSMTGIVEVCDRPSFVP